MVSAFDFLQELLVLYGIAAVGFFFRRLKIIPAEADQVLTQVVLYISLPALILYAMDQPFSYTQMADFAWLFILSAYALGIASLLALLLSRQRGIAPERQGVYQGLMVFGNQGFLGYAVGFAFFSTSGVVYITVFNILYLLWLWTYGTYLIAKGKSSIPWRTLFFNPGVLATCCGMLLFFLPVRWPTPVSQFLFELGQTTTPLSMLLVGSLLANVRMVEFRSMCRSWHLWQVVAVKLIILPLLLWPFIWSPIHFSLLAISILLTAMPSAPTTSLFAQKYRADTAFASVGVCVSTLLSMLTLPLLLWLLES